MLESVNNERFKMELFRRSLALERFAVVCTARERRRCIKLKEEMHKVFSIFLCFVCGYIPLPDTIQCAERGDLYTMKPLMYTEKILPPEKKYARRIFFHLFLIPGIDSFPLFQVRSAPSLVKQLINSGIMIRENIESIPDLRGMPELVAIIRVTASTDIEKNSIKLSG
jgi:hypothetical protein